MLSRGAYCGRSCLPGSAYRCGQQFQLFQQHVHCLFCSVLLPPEPGQSKRVQL